MGRIVVEIPGSEFPESLIHLLPGGSASPGSRYRLAIEEIDGTGQTTPRRHSMLDGVAAGLADFEAGYLIDESALFERLLAKHPATAV